MGTHPIFESDFDCLTEKMRSTAVARLAVSANRVNPASAVGEVKEQTISDQLNTKERADYARATSRLRVLTLYKAYIMSLDSVIRLNKSSVPKQQLMRLIKNEFARNSNVTDTRAIERMLVKGQMELQELVDGFAQETHFHRRLDDLLQNDAKPDDFISQFLAKKH